MNTAYTASASPSNPDHNKALKILFATDSGTSLFSGAVDLSIVYFPFYTLVMTGL